MHLTLDRIAISCYETTLLVWGGGGNFPYLCVVGNFSGFVNQHCGPLLGCFVPWPPIYRKWKSSFCIDWTILALFPSLPSFPLLAVLSNHLWLRTDSFGTSCTLYLFMPSLCPLTPCLDKHCWWTNTLTSCSPVCWFMAGVWMILRSCLTHLAITVSPI